MKKKVLLAIRSLDVGGAERYVLELSRMLDATRYDVHVITMYEGLLDSQLSVPHWNVSKKGRWDVIGFFGRLYQTLKEIQPDIVYSHQGEMNTFMAILQPWFKFKLLWCFHQTFIDFRHYDKMSHLFYYLQRLLSRTPETIVCVAQAGLDFYTQQGFFMQRAKVIQNGIDTDIFLPNFEKKDELRQKFFIPERSFVIGISARLDYMKGYPFLAKAAQRICQEFSHVEFVSIGKDNPSIRQECEELLRPFESRFHWLGIQEDMTLCYPMFDGLVSASLGEAFSLAIAEAMSCGIVCVVTDVGDSRTIVGDTGIIVKAADDNALYEGLKKLVTHSWDSSLCRERIVNNFSLRENVISVMQLL